MKPTIRVIKRRRDEESKELLSTENEQSTEKAQGVALSTRDIANTIKGWIADMERRKRTQVRSFASFSLATTDPSLNA
jgi:hypothetical protein